MLRVIAILLLSALVAGAPAPASAQSYPVKPVELIVPFPAGGRTDIIARQWAQAASRHLGQQVVVVQKVGGGGAVGSIHVMNAPADGYTLMATTIGNQVLRPISAEVPYRYDSFAPIGQLSAATLVLAAKSDRPWKDLKELAADARKRPGEITFGTPLKLLPHLTVARYAKAAGIDLKLVPQTGDAPAITATLGGHIDMVVASLGSVLPHLKTGALRALGTFSAARDPGLPNVATATEQGYAVVGEPWTGIAGPKGLPPAVLAKVRQAFAEVLKDPEFVAAMDKLGERIVPLNADAFGARWKQDYDGLEAVIKPPR
jgi:tripartite-type tricarboxylate transporter receptor subunit TctC